MTDVKIVSDGLASNTVIYINGEKADNVKSVEISPITNNSVVTAKIEFIECELDIIGVTES